MFIQAGGNLEDLSKDCLIEQLLKLKRDERKHLKPHKSS